MINTQQFIAIFLIYSLIVGGSFTLLENLEDNNQVPEWDSTKINNKTNAMLNTEKAFHQQENDTTSQQDEAQMDKTAGNTLAMGIMVWGLIKGLTPVYEIQMVTEKAQTNTEKMLGMFLLIFRMLISIYVIILIYDKLKNRKQD